MSPKETKELECNLVMSAYQQICENYRAIDDFRAKLLALLPIASAVGIFLLLDKSPIPEYLLPIGIFGVIVSAGLFAYELHGIKKCDQLIQAGLYIENKKHIYGPFTRRPGRVELLTLKNKKGPYLNEPVAARIIYPAVIAAWAYLAVFKWSVFAAAIAAIIIYIIGFWFPGILNLKGDGVADENKKKGS